MNKISTAADSLPSETSQSRFWLGPLIIFLTLSAYKCIHLSQGSYDRLLLLVKLDLPILGPILLLCFLAGVLRPKALRFPVHVALVAMLLAFAAHTASLILFDQNLSIQDVTYLVSGWKWDAFFKWWYVAPILGTAAVYFLRVPLSPAISPILLLAAPLCLIAGLWPTEQVLNLAPELRKYAYDVSDVHALFRGDRLGECRPVFSDKETESAKKEKVMTEEIKISARRPSLLLVIVESLSAVDSFRTSGLHNRLSRFDKMSEDGMLFTNFFANHYITDGGLVALLTQTAPVPFPGAGGSMLNGFAEQRSVPRDLKRQGYRSEFLATRPLSFENLHLFAPRLGFDAVGGYQEIERFRGRPSFTRGLPADEWLFEETIERVRRLSAQKQPFFVTVLTGSSHVPWVDPLQRGNTEENVVDYVDQQLERLYVELRESGFFEKGVLLVAGDHRKPTPVGSAEWASYGETSKARVPLVVIGAGIPKGVLDRRFFQQADLFRRFDDINNPGKPLTSEALFVDHYGSRWSLDSEKGSLTVYREGESGIETYSAMVNGTCFEWKGAKPAQFDKLERRIQVVRAAQQAAYAERAATQ